ncbi:hypothetical protein TNCV_1038111 [Trichonephila clavipes]|nr:hypothetical protein TNCV_1038111 [Trichonephila clavipes]
MATLKPVKLNKCGVKWTSSIFALDPAVTHCSYAIFDPCCMTDLPWVSLKRACNDFNERGSKLENLYEGFL